MPLPPRPPPIPANTPAIFFGVHKEAAENDPTRYTLIIHGKKTCINFCIKEFSTDKGTVFKHFAGSSRWPSELHDASRCMQYDKYLLCYIFRTTRVDLDKIKDSFLKEWKPCQSKPTLVDWVWKLVEQDLFEKWDAECVEYYLSPASEEDEKLRKRALEEDDS